MWGAWYTAMVACCPIKYFARLVLRVMVANARISRLCADILKDNAPPVTTRDRSSRFHSNETLIPITTVPRSMSRDSSVVMLHTVSTLFDEGKASELREAIEQKAPEIDLQVARTPSQSEEMIETATIALTALPIPDLIGTARSLRWIQALNAGVDFYDLDRLQDEGIVFTNASGVGAEPIAEQVLGYMLLFERGIDQGLRQQERGVWERYEGGELQGKTLGIIGLGAIGSRVAELGRALGMTVIGTKRDTETATDAADEVWTPDETETLLTRSDYVVVACPLTEDTRGLLGETEFRTMQSKGVLINIARGQIVDEQALTTALQQRTIRAAALDVFEQEPLPQKSPLWDLSNVLITPHMAGYTPHYMERIAKIFEENYTQFTRGESDEFVNRIV
jgi:phosphoglycerate dehydrogenase-like enzyme